MVFKTTVDFLKIFPLPPESPTTMQDIEKRIRVRALAFKEGGCHLIATYLSHGIVSVSLILSRVLTTYRHLEVAGILCIPTPSYYGHLCLCTPIDWCKWLTRIARFINWPFGQWPFALVIWWTGFINIQPFRGHGSLQDSSVPSISLI